LTPQVLCVVYVTLLWSTREAEVVLLFVGQMACEAANFLLKRIIREERPARIALHGKGYGMPSSHAQFVSFWAVALALFLLARHQPTQATSTGASSGTGRNGAASRMVANGAGKIQANGRSASFIENALALYTDPQRPWSWWERAIVSTAAIGVSGLVAWSRVYLGYHTPKQVAAGWLAGAVCALGWFVVTSIVRQSGLLDLALGLPLARWVRLRDLVVKEDLAQAGWEKWEAQQRRIQEAKTR
jgi:dolichyldiphosphatase